MAGPCVIENDKNPFEIGSKVKSICDDLDIEYIFKASYRKANRTMLGSFQTIGDKEGLEIIKAVGEELGVPTLTDVHESKDTDMVVDYVDYIQIPAFLCRQTDLLIAAGKTGKGINIKKGQFISPEAMKFPLEKVKSTGNNNIWLCERGFAFGYDNLIVDATSVPRLKKHNVPVVMDCTHSLQQPNQSTGVTGGNPEMIESLALSAIATGVDGLFIETHPDPSQALSDGSSMLPLMDLRNILTKAMKIREALND